MDKTADITSYAHILNCTAAITAIPICVIAVTQNFTEVK